MYASHTLAIRNPYASKTGFCQGLTSGEAVFFEKVTALAVFHFDDPEVRIEAALAMDAGIDILLGASGVEFPSPCIIEEIPLSGEGFGLAVKGGEFDQDGPCGVIPVVDDKGWDVMKAQAGKIGIDPEAGRKARLRHCHP
jgi:hypothetical protein